MAELPPVESATVSAIYAYYETTREPDERNYLGMSAFGTECDRALWYGWRKAHPPQPLDGRKIRLFATGHREEERIVADLQAAGITVQEHDPATERQWSVSSIGGHFRGHLDGRAWGVPEAPKTEHLIEVKTHNEKSFKALLKDGVEKSKPGHFAQVQLYMHHAGLTRALYVAQNKNDEGLYAERVAYDPVAATAFVSRAERIIRAPQPPAKLHEDPTSRAAYSCGWCPARGICHEGEFARRHCRTCLHSTPIVDGSDAGRWRCERHNRDLSPEDQVAGCGLHLFIPGLVPGEQVDAEPEAETVTYELRDGSTWVDGAVGGVP